MCDETDEFNKLLKGLSYFFDEVLFSAQHEAVWAVDDIERGIGWALYCEKAIQEPHVACSLGSHLESNPFKENYAIEDLNQLRKMLISNLFINQLIPKDVSSSLMQISVRELGNDQTLEIINTSVNKIKKYETVVTVLRRGGFAETYNTLKVRLLMEGVSSASIPYTALNPLLKSDGIIESLLKLSESLCEQEKNRILRTLGKWIKISFNKDNINHDLFNQVALLSAHRISFICDKFPGLEIKLLEVINYIGKHLTIANSVYKNELKYKCLVTLCHTFLKSEDLATIAQTAFSSWFMSKEAHFWHNLYVEAQK